MTRSYLTSEQPFNRYKFQYNADFMYLAVMVLPIYLFKLRRQTSQEEKAGTQLGSSFYGLLASFVGHKNAGITKGLPGNKAFVDSVSAVGVDVEIAAGPSGDADGSVAPASEAAPAVEPASGGNSRSAVPQSPPWTPRSSGAPSFVKRLPRKYRRRVRTETEVQTAAAVYVQSAWRSKAARTRFRRDMEQRQMHLNSFNWPMFGAVMLNFVANTTMNHVPCSARPWSPTVFPPPPLQGDVRACLWTPHSPWAWKPRCITCLPLLWGAQCVSQVHDDYGVNDAFYHFWFLIVMCPCIGLILRDVRQTPAKRPMLSVTHQLFYIIVLYPSTFYVFRLESFVYNQIDLALRATRAQVLIGALASLFHVFVMTILFWTAKKAICLVAAPNTSPFYIFPLQAFDAFMYLVFFQSRALDRVRKV
jgi:hypothetical protein